MPDWNRRAVHMLAALLDSICTSNRIDLSTPLSPIVSTILMPE
jgi:hypothetical protein